MPLHLLGKKSWNVYNADNIARVRADEAAVAAVEHAQEQRMQEADAARRLAFLRGETPPPPPAPEPEIDPSDSKNFSRKDKTSARALTGRKRKRHGEDDTDFEMRLVKERAELGKRAAVDLSDERAASGGGKRRHIDIVGRDGHIDLVGATPPRGNHKEEKNVDYEEEAARKRRELEDQYTMRFSTAAGRDGVAAADPWYTSASARNAVTTGVPKQYEVGIEASTKNVWGRDDPKRQEREMQRITSNDPLSMMRKGAQRVREVEKRRKRANEERARELEELRRAERRLEKRQKLERQHRHSGRDGHGDSSRHSHRPDRSEHQERQHGERRWRRARHRSEDRLSSMDRQAGYDRRQRRLSDKLSHHPYADGESKHRHLCGRDGDNET
ncbi:unnamed protein product [Discula destructiva]